MVNMFEHQKKALELTENQNKCSVKGYEGLYEVDTDGNVYSCLTNKTRRKGILKPYVKNGYLAVNLYINNKCKHYYIHRLVAEAFIPNSNDLPCVNHIDGNKENNSLENLEWCTRSENEKHAYKNDLEIHYCKLSKRQVKEIRELYVPKSKNFGTVALAKKYKVSQSTIYNIIKGLTYKEGDNYVKD